LSRIWVQKEPQHALYVKKDYPQTIEKKGASHTSVNCLL
jgi:hypothetical protein